MTGNVSLLLNLIVLPNNLFTVLFGSVRQLKSAKPFLDTLLVVYRMGRVTTPRTFTPGTWSFLTP